MAKISEDCIDEAFKALKNFSKDELNDYVRAVFVRAKEIDPLQGARAMDAAAKEINEAQMKSFFSDATQKAKNIMAFDALAKPLQEEKADVRGLLAGRSKKGSYWKRTDKDSSWRKRNIPDAVKAEYEKIVKFVLGDMTHEEVEHFSSGNFDQEICDVVGGKHTDNAFTKKVADKILAYREHTKAELILSGAMKPEEFHPKRYFSAVHDAQRIINGAKSMTKIANEKFKGKYNLKENKPGWRNFIKQYIDMYDTFKKTDAVDLNGDINTAKADKIIDTTFDNITTGKSQIFTRSAVVNDREAVERKSKMFFVWKSLRAQYEYNKVYGRGGLYSMLMGDAQSTAHKIGVAKTWGDNPYSMYNDLRKLQENVEPKGSLWWHNTNNYFNVVMKLDQLNDSPNATNFIANLKTLTSMARLPLIGLESISDTAYHASFAQRFGYNYFKAYGYHLSHLFDTFPTENRIKISKLMKTQVDSQLGYLGRWTEMNNVTEGLNKLSFKFFKYNLLERLDRGAKVGNMTLMGESIYGHSNKSWEKLPEQMRKYLDRFIDDKEWNLLRKKNNGTMFTTENVDNLTNEELRAHYALTDKSVPLSELRDDLYRRVYAMFSVNAENTVLAPGEFEKAFLYQGTNPGTPAGSMLRLFTHFKMYALGFIDRVLIDGMRNADTVQQKLVWATTMLMGTLPLSYASMFLKYRAMGLTMPDPSRMNVPEREKFLIQLVAPSLGIFSGLLDPRNQNSGMVLSLLGGPALSLISNAMSVPFALATGNPEKAAKNLYRAAGYVAPIQTLPGISPLLREAMGDEAHMEPGQTHIFGR